MSDSYARRQRRKKASGQACLPLAVAMLGGIVAGVEGVGRWVS